MKVLAVFAILMSAYYMAMTKIVMSQLHEMQNFYSHVDQYTANAVDGKQMPQTYNPPESIQKLSHYSLFQ